MRKILLLTEIEVRTDPQSFFRSDLRPKREAVRTEETSLVRYLLYLWLQRDGDENKLLDLAGRRVEYGPLNWPITARVLTERYNKKGEPEPYKEALNFPANKCHIY